MIPDGLMWNQAELPPADPLNAGLLSLMVIKSDLTPQLIGTAFLVTAEGKTATAVSAAHCFEEIRKLLHPNPKHHASALPAFLPPPKEINLKQVKAIYLKDGNVFACPVEIGIWDSGTDLAVFTVSAPNGESELFRDFFWIDDQVPAVNEGVAMIGFGEMKVLPDASEQSKGMMQRQLLLRIGRVEEVFPEKHYMLKGPCIETSIAVFSGMSGGLVTRWSEQNPQIKPFGFISHAPDPQPYYDRSQSGHSMGAILNAKTISLGDKKQMLQIAAKNIGVGKNMAAPVGNASFEFHPNQDDK
jgi:hypothetical protein